MSEERLNLSFRESDVTKIASDSSARIRTGDSGVASVRDKGSKAIEIA